MWSNIQTFPYLVPVYAEYKDTSLLVTKDVVYGDHTS